MATNININKTLEANLPIDGNGTDGYIYYTEKGNMYVVNQSKNKIKITDIIPVSSLPANPIPYKIYILLDNFSLNYYDSSSWHLLGRSNQIVAGTIAPTDTTKLFLDITDKTKPILKWYDSSTTSWINISSTQIQSDWNQTDNTKADYIKNKPTNLLTPNNIKQGTNVSLTTNGNDVTIDVIGSDATSINSHNVDNSTYSANRVLVADNSGNYTHANVTVAGLVATNGTILQPSGSPITIASGEEKTFSYPSCYADKMLINIQEQIAGSSITDNHLDFSNSSKYNLQDNEKVIVSNNTVKLDLYTKLLMHMDELTFKDEYGHTVTNNGVTLDTTNKVFGNGSAYFNGTSNYLNASNNSDFNFGTNDFTISWREYLTNSTSPMPVICFQSSISDSSVNALAIGYTYNGTRNVYITSNGTSWDIINGGSFGIPIINSWTHYALTRKGNNFYLFQNGILKSTFVSTSPILYNSAWKLYIGIRFNNYFGGNIEEVKIINGRALWISDFTIPTQQTYNPYLPLYLKTTGSSNFSLTTTDTITSLLMPTNIPTNTSCKILTSFDNGTNWLSHDETGWHKYTGNLTQSWENSNSNTDLQTYFTNLSMTTLKSDLNILSIMPISLDFMWQLNTTDLTVTPIVSPVTLTYTTLPHLESSTFGRYDDAYTTFGVKIIRDPNDNTKTNQMAIKNLSNKSRIANPNVIVTTS